MSARAGTDVVIAPMRAAHIEALPDDERVAYRAGAVEALRLVGRQHPELAALLQGIDA